MPAQHKISVVANLLDPGTHQSLVLAREFGFAGVMFDAYGSSLRLPDLAESGQREFLRMLSKENLALVGLQGDLGSKGLGPGADVDRLIDGVDRAMNAAKGLGSPLLCIDLGPLPEPAREIKAKPTVTAEQAGLILLPEAVLPAASEPVARTPPPDPAFVASVDGALAELGARSDRYSVVVAFRSELSSFAALEEALKRARCPWFGIDLDPTAMLRDRWPRDEILSRCGGMLRHVRGKDALSGADRRTKASILRRGDVGWANLLAELEEASYAGWITVDSAELPDRIDAARQGAKALRR